MTLDQALTLPAVAEVNWGELAHDLLTAEQIKTYERLRQPAWDMYQAAVNRNRHNHWTVNADIMPFHWNEYRAAVANAFKTAAGAPAFKPNEFDHLADMLNGRQPIHPNGNWGIAYTGGVTGI